MDNYIQPQNPTNEERYEMIKKALQEVNRIEDFDNILELLAPPKDITKIDLPGKYKNIKVGIIGGGLAGMCSAFELRKLGFDITIFEMQKKRIGGRVYTYYFDKDKRFYGELGAMRIPVSHETTWHYINLFNLKTNPFIEADKNAFIYVRNKRAKNDPQGKSVMEKIYPEFNLDSWERTTPWQELVNYGVENTLLQLDPSIRKELLQIKKQYSPEIEHLGSVSTRKMLKQMGLSEGAMELISNVYPFRGYLFYNSYFETLQESYSVDGAYRYKVNEGTNKLPLAFYKSLISKNPKEYFNIEEEDLGKVTWKNGKIVTGIYKRQDNKVTIEYKNEKFSQTFDQTFDFVICAIPFSSLRNVKVHPMFTTEKMQAIREINYESAQKTIFMCNKCFWDKQGIKEGSSYTDLPIGTIWYPKCSCDEKSNICNNSGNLLASYNLNQDAIRLGNLENKMRFNEIKRQVEEVNGLSYGYLDSIIKDFKTIQWDNEKGFYGGFSYFMPEQQSLFSYATIKPEYDNRVYFVGEHASVSHGWIQGSLNSGMQAANSIAEYCKYKSLD